MNKLITLTALTLMSFPAFSAEKIPTQDYVSGQCVSKILKNKSEFKPLKNSEVVHNFKILSHFDSDTPKKIGDGRGRVNMNLKLVRVMPNMVNAIGDYNELSIKKNQVMIFLDDAKSMSEAKSLSKDGSLKIDNFGKQAFKNPISVAFTYNGRGQDKSPRIRTSAMSTGGSIDETVMEFKGDKEVEFKVETPVQFSYRNFEYSGFLGLGKITSSEESANKKLEQDGWKTHKGKFEMKCTFKLSEISKKEKKEKKAVVKNQNNENETKSLNNSISGVEIELNDTKVIRE